MADSLKITVRADNRMEGLCRLSAKVIQNDLEKGRFGPFLKESVKSTEEVAPFIDGFVAGMTYGFALVLDGKVNLQIIEKTDPGKAG